MPPMKIGRIVCDALRRQLPEEDVLGWMKDLHSIRTETFKRLGLTPWTHCSQIPLAAELPQSQAQHLIFSLSPPRPRQLCLWTSAPLHHLKFLFALFRIEGPSGCKLRPLVLTFSTVPICPLLDVVVRTVKRWRRRFWAETESLSYCHVSSMR